MSDRTPHEGGRHTPEDLLDALLASNRLELLGTMTHALDTHAGLRALATLRTGPPAKIEDRPSEATTPPTDHHAASTPYEYAALHIEEDPSPVVELIRDFVGDLRKVRNSPGMPWQGTEACKSCILELRTLSVGLERRVVTRGQAAELLARVAVYLETVRSVAVPAFLASEIIGLIVALIEQEKTLRVVVARMFDDTYDNISIEN
jgi:hypothetical protein